MAGTEAGGLLRESFGELQTVAGEVVRGAVDALLQHAAGIEGVEDGVGVARERALALELEVGGEGAQAVHLVAHFSGRGIGRLAKSLVLRLQPFDECVEFGVEGVAGGGEFLFGFDGHGAGGEALRERCGILFGEDLFEGEIVFAKQLGDGRLDERGGEARDGRRLAAENALEENRGLREVGDFGGTTDLRRGREQKILKDGAKKRRGRDALGLGVENAEEIGCGVGLAVGVPEAVGLGGRGRGAAKSDARAGFVVDEEQEARLRSDGDLNVIAGGFEGLAAFGECGVKLVGALDGGAEDGRAEAMEVAAGGVDDEKALRGEKSAE